MNNKQRFWSSSEQTNRKKDRSLNNLRKDKKLERKTRKKDQRKIKHNRIYDFACFHHIFITHSILAIFLL